LNKLNQNEVTPGSKDFVEILTQSALKRSGYRGDKYAVCIKIQTLFSSGFTLNILSSYFCYVGFKPHEKRLRDRLRFDSIEFEDYCNAIHPNQKLDGYCDNGSIYQRLGLVSPPESENKSYIMARVWSPGPCAKSLTSELVNSTRALWVTETSSKP